MLIDSGAEISAISEKYQKKFLQDDPKMPTIPLSGLVIHNAVGNKSVKIKTQMLLPINIQNKTIHAPVIVIKDLNECGILGSDFLETYGATIDFIQRNISLTIKGTQYKISLVEKTVAQPVQLKVISTKRVGQMTTTAVQGEESPSKITNRIKKLIKDFPEVFCNTPGKIKGYECKIRLKNNIPINQRSYPIPTARKEAVEKEIKRMVKLDIIEPSRSPYSLPIVPVFKKNGEVRLCLDARKLNEIIISDRERPMTIDTIFSKFENVKCISTLDLLSEYWQVPLSKRSREPCSFLINGRNYSYKRLPFGLNISGSEFQKTMDRVLGSLLNTCVTIYVDNILITSEKREKNNMAKKVRQFVQGQQVLIRNHHLSNSTNNEIKKLFNIFEGPYIITRVVSNNTIAVRQTDSGKVMLINVTEVRPYFKADNQ